MANSDDDETYFAQLKESGYLYVRRAENGVVLALCPFIYTWGVCLIESVATYSSRYCYSDQTDALIACVTWDGEGDPPGPWIVHKPEGRLGPGARHNRMAAE